VRQRPADSLRTGWPHALRACAARQGNCRWPVFLPARAARIVSLMPLYRYKALNARGETLEGQMEAASDSEVALRLQELGHLPVEARLASEGGGGTTWPSRASAWSSSPSSWRPCSAQGSRSTVR
jgi:hypothetical protein